MPLEGELREFGVAEIFQLLEQQDKTGRLLLSMEGSRVEVYFRRGRIDAALPEGRTPSQDLLETLEKLGFLTAEEEDTLRELRRRDLRGLPEILEQQRILERSEMEYLLRERIKEVLFPVFSNRQGRFLFDPDKTLPSEWALSEPLAVEPIILEGLRRTDEWPIVKRRIGSFAAVPTRRVVSEDADRVSWTGRILRRLRSGAGQEPAALAAGPFSGDRRQDPYSAERVVYELIDGRRTVEEIVTASSLGEYACCRALLNLKELGWVRIDPGEGTPRVSVQAAVRSGLGRWLLAAAALLALVVGVSVYSRSVSLTWTDYSSGEGAQAVCRLLNQHQRAKVVRAVELYLEEHGTVPPALPALASGRFLRESDLRLWGRNGFSYTGEPPDSFRLLIVPAR